MPPGNPYNATGSDLNRRHSIDVFLEVTAAETHEPRARILQVECFKGVGNFAIF